MTDRWYPLPLQLKPTEKTREEYIAESKAKQAASHREILRKLRLIREAKRRGEKPPDLGPLYT